MRKLLKELPVVALIAAGALMVVSGVHLDRNADKQSIYYNQGLKLYESGDIPGALRAWERSIEEFEAGGNRSGALAAYQPPPLRRWAAAARFMRGNAFYEMQQAEPSLKEFIAAMRLNPGITDMNEVTLSDVEALERLQYDSAVNAENIFQQNPDLAKQQTKDGDGEGNGQPKKGDKPGPQRAPGDTRQGVQPGMPGSIDDI